jgi:hypothetical protein
MRQRDRLTVHQLLIFHFLVEFGVIAFHMVGQDVKPSTSVMNFDGSLALLMLHSEVVPDRTRSVTNKGSGFIEAVFADHVMEEIVQGTLQRFPSSTRGFMANDEPSIPVVDEGPKERSCRLPLSRRS